MFPEYIKMLKSRLALGSLKKFQEGLWEKKFFPNGPEIQDKLSLSQFCWGTRITLHNGAANLVSNSSVAFTVPSITGTDGFMMWTDKPWRVKLAHRNPFPAWPMAGFKWGDRGGYPSPAPCKLPSATELISNIINYQISFWTHENELLFIDLHFHWKGGKEANQAGLVWNFQSICLTYR